MAVPSKFPKEYSRTTTIHVHHRQTFLWPSSKELLLKSIGFFGALLCGLLGCAISIGTGLFLQIGGPCVLEAREFPRHLIRCDWMEKFGSMHWTSYLDTYIYVFRIRWVNTFRSSCSDHSEIYTYRRHDHPCAHMHSCLFPVHYILGMWHA